AISASQASNAARGCATTKNAILACASPQYSAHCPRYVPGVSARNQSALVYPGMRSLLPFRLGAQKLWITSSDCSRSWMGTPTGTWISLAVVTSFVGSGLVYRTSHHHR